MGDLKQEHGISQQKSETNRGSISGMTPEDIGAIEPLHSESGVKLDGSGHSTVIGTVLVKLEPPDTYNEQNLDSAAGFAVLETDIVKLETWDVKSEDTIPYDDRDNMDYLPDSFATKDTEQDLACVETNEATPQLSPYIPLQHEGFSWRGSFKDKIEIGTADDSEEFSESEPGGPESPKSIAIKGNAHHDVDKFSNDMVRIELDHNYTNVCAIDKVLGKMYCCSYCDSKFSSKINFRRHEIHHTGMQPHDCRYCDASFLEKDSLDSHEKTHSETEISRSTSGSKLTENEIFESNTVPEKLYNCAYCKAKFRKKSHLRKHAKTHTGENRYQCSVCDSKFGRISSLRAHVKTHSSSGSSIPVLENIYSCRFCTAKFRRKFLLRKHMKNHAGERTHLCCFCDSTFRRISSLRAHLKTHSGNLPYSCSYCGAKFPKKADLDHHIGTGDETTTYSCSRCDAKFTLKCTFQNHEKSHNMQERHVNQSNSDKPKKVRAIDQSSRAKLNRNKGSINKKTFSCLHCGSKFNLKSSLDRHKRTHVKKPSYDCTQCRAKFSLKCNLDKHVRIHSGEQFYDCSQCKAKFSLKRNLSKHERIHVKINNDNSSKYKFVINLKSKTAGNRKNFPAKHSNLSLTNTKIKRITQKPKINKVYNSTKIKKYGEKNNTKNRVDFTKRGDYFGCLKCDLVFGRLDNLKRHERFHARELHICGRCGYKFKQKSALERHERAHARERAFACTQCNTSFKKERDLDEHRLRHVSNGNLICHECKVEFTDEKSFMKHNHEHNGMTDTTSTDKVTSDKSPETCLGNSDLVLQGKARSPNNEINVNNRKELPMTNTLHSLKTAVTSEPDFIGCSSGEVVFHKVNHSENLRNQQTHEPVLALGSSTRRTKSHKSSHGLELRQPESDPEFIKDTELDRRRESHSTKSPHQCSYCDSKFNLKWALKIHEITHSVEQPYICSICNARFGQTDELARHEQVHLEEALKDKVDVEELAKEIYPTFDILNDSPKTSVSFFSRVEHSKTGLVCSSLEVDSNSVRPCSTTRTICDTNTQHTVSMLESSSDIFYQKHGLTNQDQKHLLSQHTLTPTGGKAYQYNSCNTRFIQKSSSSEQSQICTTERSYGCSFCDDSFSRRGSLEAHERTHSGFISNKCSHCSTAFGTNVGLCRHENIHTEKGFKKKNNFERSPELNSPSGLLDQSSSSFTSGMQTPKFDGLMESVKLEAPPAVNSDFLNHNSRISDIDYSLTKDGITRWKPVQTGCPVAEKFANPCKKLNIPTNAEDQSCTHSPLNVSKLLDVYNILPSVVVLTRLPDHSEDRLANSHVSDRTAGSALEKQANSPGQNRTFRQDSKEPSNNFPLRDLSDDNPRNYPDTLHNCINKTAIWETDKSDRTGTNGTQAAPIPGTLSGPSVTPGKRRKGRNKETKYKCSSCKATFPLKKALIRHERTHPEIKKKLDLERPFSCSHCGIRFGQKGTMKNHEKIHTGEKKFKCETCGARFMEKHHLARHKMGHTGLKPHCCEYCDKRFSQKSDLNRHVRIHTNERPYSCSFCPATFILSGNWRAHERTHTGVKPHKCNYCNARFTQKVALRQHLRLHTGEHPYTCTQCNAGFNQRGHLTYHMQMHSEKVYACSKCNATFNLIDKLKRHERKHDEYYYLAKKTEDSQKNN